MRLRAGLGLLALVVATLALSPGTASADPSQSTPAAARALARTQALLAPAGSLTQRRALADTKGWDFTLALRDLRLHLDGLDVGDRRTAERILARPTESTTYDPFGNAFAWSVTEETPVCGPDVCVHYVASTEDAATPAWVQTTLDTLEHVWGQEVTTMGYRAPKSDGTQGGDGRLDIYLSNTGSRGIYGYCTSDDPAQTFRRDVSSYCVLDNDFTGFPAGALVSLEVTAAHEFFHAVQNAYDWRADLWFMESTAAWIEDEVYDDVNDNYQYLPAGPLGHPEIPLDYFDPGTYPQYGGWVFWKLLGETYGAAVVQDVWARADHAAGGSGQWSLQALRGELAAKGTTFTDFFARFTAVNRYPGKVYSEGAAYPAAPLTRSVTLHRGLLSDRRDRLVDHLSARTWQYRPGSGLGARHTLRLAIDMPNPGRGSAATAVVHFRDGTVSARRIALDATGAGHQRLPFAARTVSSVELTVTNASTRYSCGSTGDYTLSCFGTPLDDRLRTTFTAKAVR